MSTPPLPLPEPSTSPVERETLDSVERETLTWNAKPSCGPVEAAARDEGTLVSVGLGHEHETSVDFVRPQWAAAA